ncbi:MAG: DUF6364 family protein [Candidatus Omnitrophota bacterium]
MRQILDKTKLTLWVSKDVKEFGRWWAKRNHESISHLVSVYFRRLKEIDEKDKGITPVVRRISGIIKGKKVEKESYKKHLGKKYLYA